MHGIRTFTISALLAAAAAVAHAQSVDYFPLMVGNQWVYRSADGTLALEIPRAAEFEGRTYYLLRGYPGKDYWLRRDAGGSIVAYDPDLREESVWYAFQAPEGERYRTSVPGNCCGTAMVASRKANYRGPVGEYDYALEVQYFPGIVPGGLTRELFLPWVGMVYRNEITGGREVAYDLTYSHTGATVISAPEISFALTLDQFVYTANLMPPADPGRSVPVLTARLTLRNTTAQPIELTFPSGQTYDLTIRNEKGDVVYRWSDGKAFTMVLRTEQLGPGERNWVLQVPLGDAAAGKPFPEGKYTAEAWLTTMDRQPYRASVGFELKQVF